MRQVRARFSEDEVAAFAVSTIDSEQSILNWIADTALRVPVIVDTPEDLTCWEMPGNDSSLYQHFIDRSLSDGPQPPFPLQVIYAPDGTIAMVSREHLPSMLLEVLETLVPDPSNSEAAP
jgi:hypothetical protein